MLRGADSADNAVGRRLRGANDAASTDTMPADVGSDSLSFADVAARLTVPVGPVVPAHNTGGFDGGSRRRI